MVRNRSDFKKVKQWRAKKKERKKKYKKTQKIEITDCKRNEEKMHMSKMKNRLLNKLGRIEKRGDSNHKMKPNKLKQTNTLTRFAPKSWIFFYSNWLNYLV